MDNDSRSLTKVRQDALSAALGEVDTAISLVLEGFGGRTANPDKVMAYAIALEGLSSQDLARGVRAILRGEVADIDPAFPPTAAQLARACRKASATFLSKPPEWFQTTAPREPDPEPTDEQKARVDAVILEAIAGMRRTSLAAEQQAIQQREEKARAAAERRRRVAEETLARQIETEEAKP